MRKRKIDLNPEKIISFQVVLVENIDESDLKYHKYRLFRYTSGYTIFILLDMKEKRCGRRFLGVSVNFGHFSVHFWWFSVHSGRVSVEMGCFSLHFWSRVTVLHRSWSTIGHGSVLRCWSNDRADDCVGFSSDRVAFWKEKDYWEKNNNI